MYSPEIAQAMTLRRFGEIDRNIKLLNNYADKSRDQEGYNLTYRFDLPYKDLVANTNSISAKYDMNQVIDESSWPHCGYGESGYRVCVRISQNTNFEKGGNKFLYMDAGRFHIYARACIATSSTITRNRFGQMQGHTNSTYFSVLFWKWYVE